MITNSQRVAKIVQGDLVYPDPLLWFPPMIISSLTKAQCQNWEIGIDVGIVLCYLITHVDLCNHHPVKI